MTDIIVGEKLVKDIEVAIFDKDGTLIDVHAYWSSMVRMRADKICERLGLDDDKRLGLMDSMGVDVAHGRIKQEGPVGIKKREIVRGHAVKYLLGDGIEVSDEEIVSFFTDVDKASLNHLDEIIKPLPGMYELIAGLNESGVKVAIATTDRTERALLALKHLGIDEQVDCVVGADMVSKPKPDPEMINVICEKLDVNSSRSVMVGDALLDLEMGSNANVAASIGVESGLMGKSELERVTKYVVQDVSHIHVAR